MQIIKDLAAYIDEELGDAQKYVKKALHMKTENPQLAQVFFQLSMEEMEHMNRLHTEVERLIVKTREDGTKVPEGMMLAYDIIHDKMIEWAKDIKIMQNMFRE